MCRFALLVVAVTLLVGSMAQAASYKKTNGTIVDPILDTSGSTHPYSGNNLKAGAILDSANLAGANLTGANLTGAGLHYADLPGAFLTDANLTGANLYMVDLTNANLIGANLTNTNLRQAYLTGANLSGASFGFGTTLPDGQTVLQHGFDAVGLQFYLETGFDNVWAADNLTIVPEPSTWMLLIIGILLGVTTTGMAPKVGAGNQLIFDEGLTRASDCHLPITVHAGSAGRKVSEL